MRIIAGTHRRRQLVTPAGHSTRPMPDRLRETLFDILNKRVLNRVFVDLYAGSGAVGFEALSRGARKVIFVENSHAAIQALWKNISALGVQDTCSVFASPTEKVLPSIDGEIYFIGAPYIFQRIRDLVVCACASGNCSAYSDISGDQSISFSFRF